MAAPRPAAIARGWIAACAALALANLLGALLGGLQRLGAALALHGALMMAGFFASLISLERVVALRRGRWLPLASGAAGLLALAGQAQLAAGLWLLTAAGLLELYLWAGRHRAWSLPLAVEASAALALLGAAAAHAAGAPELAR